MTKKITVPIRGMHCTACEILTEEKLKNIPGVKSVKSSHLSGEAIIEYNGDAPDQAKLKKIIKEAGYEYGEENLPMISNKADDYYEFFQALVIFLVLFWLAKVTGLADLTNNAVGSVMAWPAIILIGLTAGFSSCMALVGGLVLSVTASYAKAHPKLRPIDKFKPHLFFNLGRIIGYTLLGALLGTIGSAVHLSVSLSGWLIIIIALVMAGLGLKLLGIFPALSRYDLALPKSVASWFDFGGRADSHYSPIKTMVLGALTFFVPCGFTQAMQLYALSSGSLMIGAMTMGLFALGTAPGLLGLGGLVSVIKGKWSSVFFRLAGIAVLAFALFNLANGWNLVKASGMTLFNAKPKIVATITNQELGERGEQIIRMTQGSRGYSPTEFRVSKGVPVKWIITSTNPNSCSASIVAPAIDVNQQLVAGENIIEFTPTETGPINFTCSMGMYSGFIEVIESSPSSSIDTRVNGAQIATETKKVEEKVSVEPSASVVEPVVVKPAVEKTNSVIPAKAVKVFSTSYTLADDIQPSEFITKIGQPTRIDVFAKEDGQGCMRDILIQGLSEAPQRLVAGETVSMSFTPQEKGTYLIVCAMNIPRGRVIVE